MEPRRDSFIEFFTYNYNFIRRTLLPLLALVIYLARSAGDYSGLIQNLFWVIGVFFVVFSFFQWRNRVFEIKEERIRISEGVINKSQNDIPFSRIKSVNTSDTLLKRIFGIAILNIELVGGKRVSFVMKDDDVENIKKNIFNDVEEERAEKRIEKLKIGQYALIAISSAKIFFGSLSVAMAVFTFGSNLIFGEQEIGTTSPMDLKADFDESATFFLVVALGLFVFFGILAFIVSVGYSYLTYNNFQISSDEKELHIDYGFLNKKQYLIPKKQVRTLIVAQPLALRIFGYVQLRVVNIGLDENGNSEVVLYPIIKKEQIGILLKEHLADFELREEFLKPTQKSVFVYMMRRAWKTAAVIGVAIALYPELWWTSVVVLMMMLLGWNNWRVSGIAYDEKYVAKQDGNYGGKTNYITLKKFVQSSVIETNFWMRKNKEAHYGFAVYSERINEYYICQNLSESEKNDFVNSLEKK